MTTQTIPARMLPVGSGHFLGLLLAGLCVWALGIGILTPTSTYAAELATNIASVSPLAHPQVEDPLGTLGTKMEDLAKKVAKIATPIAILCIVLVLVLYLFAPVLPDIAQQNKGYIMRALVIVAVISLVPEIVKFAGGLAS